MAGSVGQSMSFSMRTTVYAIKKKFPSVRNISCQELEQWKQQGKNLVCLDTRPADEYNVSHLVGSVRVDPEGDIDLGELCLPTESTVVCYCSVGYRSSSVAQKLVRAHRHTTENASQRSIYNLEGGVFQWVCEGRGLVDAHGEGAAVVHPYSAVWGKLLPKELRQKL